MYAELQEQEQQNDTMNPLKSSSCSESMAASKHLVSKPTIEFEGGDPYYMDDWTVLYKGGRWQELFPLLEMDINERCNAVFRLSVILALVFWWKRLDIPLKFVRLPPLVAFVIVVVVMHLVREWYGGDAGAAKMREIAADAGSLSWSGSVDDPIISASVFKKDVESDDQDNTRTLFEYQGRVISEEAMQAPRRTYTPPEETTREDMVKALSLQSSAYGSPIGEDSFNASRAYANIKGTGIMPPRHGVYSGAITPMFSPA